MMSFKNVKKLALYKEVTIVTNQNNKSFALFKAEKLELKEIKMKYFLKTLIKWEEKYYLKKERKFNLIKWYLIRYI